MPSCPPRRVPLISCSMQKGLTLPDTNRHKHREELEVIVDNIVELSMLTYKNNKCNSSVTIWVCVCWIWMVEHSTANMAKQTDRQTTSHAFIQRQCIMHSIAAACAEWTTPVLPTNAEWGRTAKRRRRHRMHTTAYTCINFKQHYGQTWGNINMCRHMDALAHTT